MDQLTKARVGKLEALTRCPACGSQKEGSAGRQGAKAINFACGSQFRAEIGRAIEPTVICPASSNIAAEQLNDEVLHDLQKAGAA